MQYKTSGGGKVIRTDIQVGDDTRRYFPVSIWQKQMESMLKPGNIILLQSEFHLTPSILSSMKPIFVILYVIAIGMDVATCV